MVLNRVDNSLSSGFRAEVERLRIRWDLPPKEYKHFVGPTRHAPFTRTNPERQKSPG